LFSSGSPSWQEGQDERFQAGVGAGVLLGDSGHSAADGDAMIFTDRKVVEAISQLSKALNVPEEIVSFEILAGTCAVECLPEQMKLIFKALCLGNLTVPEAYAKIREAMTGRESGAVSAEGMVLN